jgi:hypothetical protein
LRGDFVKIVWEQSIYNGSAPIFCAICGHQSYPVRSQRNQLLLAVLYDRKGVAWGEVCRDCVAAGSPGIRSRLQERIQSLRDKMNELESFAREEIETPSLEEEFQIHRQDAS